MAVELPKMPRSYWWMWAGTAGVLALSNNIFGNRPLISDPSDAVDRFLGSIAKSVLIGCPFIFIPNMTYRTAKAVCHRDVNYLIPPFYYRASEHVIYHGYTTKK